MNHILLEMYTGDLIENQTVQQGKAGMLSFLSKIRAPGGSSLGNTAYHRADDPLSSVSGHLESELVYSWPPHSYYSSILLS